MEPGETRRPLADLAPSHALAQEEEAAGERVRYLAAFNGTGLQLSEPLWQVRHGCGQWTWRDFPFCMHCGQPVGAEPAPQPVASVAAQEHPMGSFNNPLRRTTIDSDEAGRVD